MRLMKSHWGSGLMGVLTIAALLSTLLPLGADSMSGAKAMAALDRPVASKLSTSDRDAVVEARGDQVAAGVACDAGPSLGSVASSITCELDNPTCGDFGLGDFEEKIEPVSSGTYDVGPNCSVTITVNNTSNGQTFDFEMTGCVAEGIFVKGGPNGNLYTYVPGVTSDSDLHSPINPSNGRFYGLSHISFCVREVCICEIEGPETVCPNEVNTYRSLSANCPDEECDWSLSGSCRIVEDRGCEVDVQSAGCDQSCELCVTIDGEECDCITIRSEDDQDPTFTTCAGDETHECPADPACDPATCADNCNCIVEGPSASDTPGCGQTFTRMCTSTARDDCDNTATCVQTIRVVDTTSPTIDTPPTGRFFECPGTPEFDVPGCNDTCGECTVDMTSDSSTGTCPEVHTRCWKATDDCGNMSGEVCQDIEARDTTPPSITCPPDIEVCEGGTVDFTPPGCSDACGGCSVECVRSDGMALGAEYPVGTTTITCTATDDCENPSQCMTDVTVGPEPTCDLTSAEVTGMGEITGGTVGGGTAPYTCSASFTNGWVDTGCSVDAGGNITVNFQTPVPTDSTTLTVFITDASGCETECSGSIQVAVGCTVDPADPICLGDSRTLTAAIDVGIDGQTIDWFGPFSGTVDCTTQTLGTPLKTCSGLNVGDTCDLMVSPGSAGTYSWCARDTEPNGVVSFCRADLVVNPNPDCFITADPDGVICETESAQFCAPAGMTSYSWDTGATSQCITVSVAGEYCVTVTDANGCDSRCCRTLETRPCFEACSPGFWRNHDDAWCAHTPFNPRDNYCFDGDATGFLEAFEIASCPSAPGNSAIARDADLTLLEAVSSSGGNNQTLFHCSAALLSAHAVNFPAGPGAVIDVVQDACDGTIGWRDAQRICTDWNAVESIGGCPISGSSSSTLSNPLRQTDRPTQGLKQASER